jgi:T5SS/PEP-CTERM-associated repeat protein
MRPRHAALALPFFAAAALAARIDVGDVFVVPQPPFSNITVIGLSSVGSITIDGGTQEELPAVAMGGLATGEGTLTVTGAGSKLTTTGDATTRANVVGVGITGSGELEVTNGAAIEMDGANNLAGDLGASFAVGVEASGAGTVLIQDADLTVTNGAASPGGVAVAVGGNGIFVLDGGSVAIDTGTGANGGLSVGTSAGSSGFLHATGADSTIVLSGTGRNLSVGTAGAGELLLEQGASLTGAQVGFVGLEESADGELRVASGAELAITGANPLLGFGGALQVGAGGTGLVEVIGGSIVVDEPLGSQHGVQIGGAIGCGGPCPFTGGTGELAVVAGGTFSILGALGSAVVGADGDGTLRVADGSSFVVENPDDSSGISVGASAGATGTLLVTGAGSLVDAGVGLLAGLDLGLGDAGSATVTAASGGTLLAPFVTLGTDAVLRGDGTVTAIVDNLRGTIAPGLSIGTLSIGGDLDSAGVLEIEAAGTGAGEFDVLATGGALNLSGGTVRIELEGGFLPQAGDELVIATATGVPNIAKTVVREVRGAAPGFDFEVVPDGNALVFRAIGDAEGFGSCQVAQLKAMSKLCKKHFDCHATFAKKSAKDPGGAKRDACLAAGEAAFAKAYTKAAAKAAKKGEPCGATAPAAETDDVVVDAVAELVAGIETGFTPGTNAADDTLRASLLGSSGTLCAALLKAESTQAKKRDDAKRAAARDKAEAKFAAAAERAFTKAAGVVYGGTPSPEVAENVAIAVGDATGVSAGVAP